MKNILLDVLQKKVIHNFIGIESIHVSVYKIIEDIWYYYFAHGPQAVPYAIFMELLQYIVAL